MCFASMDTGCTPIFLVTSVVNTLYSKKLKQVAGRDLGHDLDPVVSPNADMYGSRLGNDRGIRKCFWIPEKLFDQCLDRSPPLPTDYNCQNIVKP